MPTLKFEGCCMFRERIVASILSKNPLKIEKIRHKDQEAPGLQDFEASFLRLVEQISDGCHVEINETGTTLRLKPGVLVGGGMAGRPLVHNCGLSRSIGWFIEGLLPLAIFCKNPVNIVLSGITNDELDISVDVLKTVTFPLLLNFNIWGITMKVRRRGAKPKGGGEVELLIPPVRGALNPLHVTDEGLVKRVRGTVFSTKVSPQIANRVISACREVLNHVLPDVFINTDTYKGKLGGDSPGYSVSLVAESTSGALLSVERTAVSRVGGVGGVGGGVELPEDIGREAAMMLLSEVQRGGVVDTVHQPLVLMLMVLTPEDVSKVRFGVLSPQAIMMLRLLREAFGVTFKIKEDRQMVQIGLGLGLGGGKKRKGGVEGSKRGGEEEEGDEGDKEEDEDEEEEDDEEEGEDNDDEEEDEDNEEEEEEEEEGGVARSAPTSVERVTVLLSCYGVGYANVNRRAT